MKIINWLKKVAAHPYWKHTPSVPMFVVGSVIGALSTWLIFPWFAALYCTWATLIVLFSDWQIYEYKAEAAKKQQQIEELQDFIDNRDYESPLGY